MVASALLRIPCAEELGFVSARLEDEALLSSELGREMLDPADLLERKEELLDSAAPAVDGSFEVFWPGPELSVDE